MYRYIRLIVLCCFLLVLTGCPSDDAKAAANNIVQSGATWTAQKAAGDRVVLSLSTGVAPVVIPASHDFAKIFKELGSGTFLYCTKCSSEPAEVGTYVAPNTKQVADMLAARRDIGPGL